MLNPFVWELLHWGSLLIATYFSYIYFRDLGDVTQALMSVERKNMLYAIRNENKMIAAAFGGTAIASVLHFWQDAGIDWVFSTLAIANVAMIAIVWGWLHIGLRGHNDESSHQKPPILFCVAPVIKAQHLGCCRQIA